MVAGPEPGSFVITGSGQFNGYTEHTDATKLYMNGFSFFSSGCFRNYAQLRSIVFDDNATELDNNFNLGLNYITTLNLPKSVVKLSPYQAFDGTGSLSRVFVHEENPSYTDVDGVVYSKDMKTLYYWPSQHGETIAYVPYGTVNIACAAFAVSSNFKKIFFPPTTRNVESYQFTHLSSIEYIEFKTFSHQVHIDPNNLLQYSKTQDRSIIHYKPVIISCELHHYFMNTQNLIILVFILIC